MDLTDRIRQIIDFYRLPPTAFADRIEVARPIISHILSGRNKASLEVVQKIMTGFPQINPDWLLLGTGKMQRLENQFSAEKNCKNQDAHENTDSDEVVTNEQVQKKPEAEIQLHLPKAEVKQIEKVIIFFGNGSFKEYSPEE